MTRDEAQDRLRAETRSSCTESLMIDFIDMAVALGILKLDEPKSAREKFIDCMKAQGYSEISCGMDNALIAFDHALK